MTAATGVSLRRAYADSRYGQLHYRIARPAGAATRPPLICLHQTPKSGWEYEPLMPALATRRVVVAPDMPGYGDSDGPGAPTTIEDYAGVMADFMAGLAAQGVIAPGPFDALGVHTGSVVATALARTWPERVRRIVLVGLAAYDAPTRAEKLERLKAYPKPKDDLSHVQAVWGVMQTLFDPRASIAWRHRSLAENLRSGEAMSWGYSAVYRYDFLEALAEVRQPALVINPEDDLAPVTARAAGLLAQGRRVDLPGISHGLFTLETQRLATLIGGFLDEDPAPPSPTGR